MTNKLPEAWLREMCWAFGMCGEKQRNKNKKNKKNQHKLQWAINRNMQRFWGGRSCSTPLPLDGWNLFRVLALLLRCTRASLGVSLVMFNTRDCHTNSLLPSSHLGRMWSLSGGVKASDTFLLSGEAQSCSMFQVKVFESQAVSFNRVIYKPPAEKCLSKCLRVSVCVCVCVVKYSGLKSAARWEGGGVPHVKFKSHPLQKGNEKISSKGCSAFMSHQLQLPSKKWHLKGHLGSSSWKAFSMNISSMLYQVLTKPPVSNLISASRVQFGRARGFGFQREPLVVFKSVQNNNK